MTELTVKDDSGRWSWSTSRNGQFRGRWHPNAMGNAFGNPNYRLRQRDITVSKNMRCFQANLIAMCSPLGVFFHVDVTSMQWEDWKIIGWYSQSKLYTSTKDFENALLSGELEKLPPNEDGAWTSTDKQGSFPNDNLPPPITKAQGPQRFGIDTEEQYVSWTDFSFYMATDPKQGVGLFDIRYKGERLIYELALQEAVAHYAGSDPQQSETLYFDTTEGMGDSLNTLVKGYDCPSHATYLDTA